MKDQNLIKFLIVSIAIFIAGTVLPGIDVANVWVAMALAIILSLLNRLVKPLLVLLTLPITIFTLGIFMFIINGIIILIAEWILPKNWFQVSGIFWAIIFSLVIAIFTSIIERLLGIDKRKVKTDDY